MNRCVRVFHSPRPAHTHTRQFYSLEQQQQHGDSERKQQHRPMLMINDAAPHAATHPTTPRDDPPHDPPHDPRRRPRRRPTPEQHGRTQRVLASWLAWTGFVANVDLVFCPSVTSPRPPPPPPPHPPPPPPPPPPPHTPKPFTILMIATLCHPHCARSGARVDERRLEKDEKH